MGPFSFVPFMECYHGVLSMNHSIKGRLDFNGESLSFDNGKGYMERIGDTLFQKVIYGCRVIILQKKIHLLRFQ